MLPGWMRDNNERLLAACDVAKGLADKYMIYAVKDDGIHVDFGNTPPAGWEIGDWPHPTYREASTVIDGVRVFGLFETKSD